MIDLGEIIRFHRERRGWKQSELARRAEMSAAQVSYIENNRVSPSFHAVERLARAFDTDIAGLLSKKGLEDGERPPAESFALRLEELGLIVPVLRLRLREQLRAYYRAHPDAMEPHPSAPSINPATIGEGE
ncbi:MAG: helix-turn-helix domain-containing protein [Kiritimatiellia bacterium]